MFVLLSFALSFRLFSRYSRRINSLARYHSTCPYPYPPYSHWQPTMDHSMAGSTDRPIADVDDRQHAEVIRPSAHCTIDLTFLDPPIQ
jgi:hypothetical protein